MSRQRPGGVVALVIVLALIGGAVFYVLRGPSAGALSPTTPEAMADLWCPAADIEKCRSSIELAFANGQPIALCVFADGGWTFVEPDPGVGAPCGLTEQGGTIRGVIRP